MFFLQSRRLLVAAGVICIAVMGISAAEIATSYLAEALDPHETILEQATEMADQTPEPETAPVWMP